MSSPDRETKSALYATSQVDEYWIVNLAEGVMEVFRDRHEGRWRTMTIVGRGETHSMLAFPGPDLGLEHPSATRLSSAPGIAHIVTAATLTISPRMRWRWLLIGTLRE